MRKIFLSTYALLLLSFTVQTQEVSNLYFGQKPPGMIPEIFAPGFISTEEFEFSGTFTPDLKEYFFTRRPDYNGSANRLYYTKLENDTWSKPTLAPFAKDLFEFEPVMDPDGSKIYFYSERSGGRDSQFTGDLWISKKIADEWSKPEYFLSPVNKKWCMSVIPSLDGTLYFSSHYDSKRGIFKAEPQNGEYPEVEYLSEAINSTNFAHPFIAPDESYIIMDAQISGMGKPELYIAFKDENGQWTRPVNMGPEINANKTEFGASVSPDGKYLFFHRRVNGIGNIYWVDARIIEQFRSNSK